MLYPFTIAAAAQRLMEIDPFSNRAHHLGMPCPLPDCQRKIYYPVRSVLEIRYTAACHPDIEVRITSIPAAICPSVPFFTGHAAPRASPKCKGVTRAANPNNQHCGAIVPRPLTAPALRFVTRDSRHTPAASFSIENLPSALVVSVRNISQSETQAKLANWSQMVSRRSIKRSSLDRWRQDPKHGWM